MHFLSHYYVDRSRHNPSFVFGALLPDIAPHFTKTYNGKIRNSAWGLEEPGTSLHRGVLRHFELDAAFHNSVAFKAACSFASERLEEAGLDRQLYRFWFLGHIAVEVLLDRQLILANPSLVDEYYDVLSSVDIDKFDAYFKLISTEDEKRKILSTFMRFMDVRFLQYMKTMDGAVEGLSKTIQRAIHVDITNSDREKLTIALHNIEKEMRYRSKKLLEL